MTCTSFCRTFPVTMVALAVLGGFVGADDWPNWRGPTHDGISAEKGWKTTWQQPKVLWRANVGKGWSSFAVVGKRVYTMGNRDDADSVYCFDAATGREIWKQSYPCPGGNYAGPRGTPTVDGDRVYTLSREGHLNCYDAASGKVVWSKNIPAKPPTWGFASSAFIHDDRVVINVGTTGMAYDKKTGDKVWGTGRGKAGYATPVLMGKDTFLMFSAKALVAVDAADGAQKWSFPWQTKYDVNAADPLVIGNKVLISSGYGSGGVLLAPGGDAPKEVWRSRSLRTHFNSCVLKDGAVYGFDERILTCLDAKTGEVKWSHKGLGKGSLMLADDKLVILSDRGELVIAEATPAAFKAIQRGTVLRGKCWTTPILANGRIYCRTAKGDIACVDVK